MMVFGTLALCTGNITGLAGVRKNIEIVSAFALGAGKEGITDKTVFWTSGAHFVEVEDFGFDLDVGRKVCVVLGVEEQYSGFGYYVRGLVDKCFIISIFGPKSRGSV